MNNEHLKEFLELANSLNFTKAAARLHIHQSTLSKHIAALEKEFDAVFFDRDSNSVKLTEQGYCFVGHATSMAAQYERACKDLAGLSEHAGHVYIDWNSLDPAIEDLVSIAALSGEGDLQHVVRIRRSSKPSILERIRSGELDIAIGLLDTSEKDDDLKIEPLASTPFIAVVDEDHPFASRTSPLTIAELKSQTLVRLLNERFKPGWDTIKTICKDHGFTPKERPILLNSLQERQTLHLYGCVLVLSENSRSKDSLAKLSGHAYVPFDDPSAQFTLSYAYLEKSKARLEPFLESLKSSLKTAGLSPVD